MSKRADAPAGDLTLLLARAVGSRANVLIEGCAAWMRAVVARSIHAESRTRRRIFLAVGVSALPADVPWRVLLAGDLPGLEDLPGLSWTPSPDTVGAIYLEGLDDLDRAEQARLASALLAREDLVFGGPEPPRLIAGVSDARGSASNPRLDPRVERCLAVVHMKLGAGFEHEEWVSDRGRTAHPLVRIEWY